MSNPVTPLLALGRFLEVVAIGNFTANVFTQIYARGTSLGTANNKAVIGVFPLFIGPPHTLVGVTATYAGLPCIVHIAEADAAWTFSIYGVDYAQCLVTVVCPVPVGATFSGSNFVITFPPGRSLYATYGSPCAAGVADYVDPGANFSSAVVASNTNLLDPTQWSETFPAVTGSANDLLMSAIFVGANFGAPLAVSSSPAFTAEDQFFSGNRGATAYRSLSGGGETDTLTWAIGMSGTGTLVDQRAWGMAFALKALVALTITVQPTDQSVLSGQTATFSVVATGSAPLTYQWYRNGVLVAGATSASYTTPPTSVANNGDQFYVIVTDVFLATVQSNTVTLTVDAAKAGAIIQFNDSAVFSMTFGRELHFVEYTYYPVRPVLDGEDFAAAVPNMIINRYKQQPTETRKRGVDFTLFCEPGEVITTIAAAVITPVTTPPLAVSNILIDPAGQKFAYDISGGVDGTEYNVQFTVTFNTLQNTTEQVIFMIALFEESQTP